MGRRMQQKHWVVLGGFALAAVSLLVVVSDFVPGAHAEGSAPTLSVAEAVNMPTPLPYPYDESADAMAVVDAALARAEENGKRVLIDLGGNWCGWCRLLAGVMELPEMKPLMAEHFELVTVDISSAAGRIDRNLEVPARFGAEEIGGVPWMIVLASDGTVLHSSYEVTDQNHEEPQQMADWLASWAN
ncbi:MAG: thioredoxin family protein [Micropepsaceae bacterium]